MYLEYRIFVLLVLFCSNSTGFAIRNKRNSDILGSIIEFTKDKLEKTKEELEKLGEGFKVKPESIGENIPNLGSSENSNTEVKVPDTLNPSKISETVGIVVTEANRNLNLGSVMEKVKNPLKTIEDMTKKIMESTNIETITSEVKNPIKTVEEITKIIKEAAEKNAQPLNQFTIPNDPSKNPISKIIEKGDESKLNPNLNEKMDQIVDSLSENLNTDKISPKENMDKLNNEDNIMYKLNEFVGHLASELKEESKNKMKELFKSYSNFWLKFKENDMETFKKIIKECTKLIVNSCKNSLHPTYSEKLEKAIQNMNESMKIINGLNMAEVPKV